MTDRDDQFWALLPTYLEGGLSTAEGAQFEHLLAASPERRLLVNRLCSAWDTVPTTAPPPVDVSRFTDRLAAVRAESSGSQRGETGDTSRRHDPSQKPSRGFPWARAGLGALGISAAILGWVILAPGVSPGAKSATEFAEHITEAGQRATITLPDGSIVQLNNATTVRYATDFGAASRTVEVTGEALFTVASDKGAPFIVNAGNVSTKVLGTVFSVKRYADDTVTSVVVAQGKVMAGTTVLASGQIGISDAAGKVLRARDLDINAALAWTTGELRIPYVSLQQAIPSLERWFGVQVTVETARLLHRNVQLALHDETPREAFTLIAEAIGASAVWNGNTVTLRTMLSSTEGTR